jgi:hypothetical protein
MRRALLVFTLGCLATAAPVLAQPSGVALRWNHCFGEGTGVFNRSFACDTNSGVETLVGSFALAIDMASVSGSEITIDFNTAPPPHLDPFPPPGPVVPEWWRLRQPGTCRQNAMTASFVADPGNTVCQDWGAGQQVGGIGAYNIEGPLGQGRARLLMAVAVPQTALANLSGGTEYAVVTVQISHTKTVGTGACAGCGAPMFITLSRVNVVTPTAGENRLLSGPLDQINADRVTWNAGVTATRATSWATLKSLYR